MRPCLLVAALLGLAGCGDPAGQASAPASSPALAGGGLRLTAPRAAHAVVSLPDGDVLLIGGCVLDSCELGPASSTVDRFDFQSGRISSAGALDDPRVSTTAILLPSGKVLLAGGWSGATVTDSVEIFNPASGRAASAAPLSLARADIAQAALRDGRVLLAGGYADGRAHAVVELFDPRTQKTSRVAALGIGRAGASAIVLPDGRVLIAGGGETGPNGLIPSAAAEIFDPRDNSVIATGSLAYARYKHAAVGLRDGRVLVIGGSDERDGRGKIRAMELFDSATGRFGPAGDTLDPRYKIASAVVLLRDGRVLIGGGGERAEVYDPATRRSAHVDPPLGETRNFASASLLPDGSVLVAGGYSEDGIHVRDAAGRVTAPKR
jgi:hypothetical protein